MARIVFCWAANFLTKNAPKISPKCLSLDLVSSKNPEKSAKFPTIFPSEKARRNSPTSFCRSAGRTTTVSESTASNIELSELFLPSLSSGRKLSEFVSASYLCVSKQTHLVSGTTHRARTHRACLRTQRVLSSETVLSEQFSARFQISLYSLQIPLNFHFVLPKKVQGTVMIQNEIGTRSERDINLHNLRPLRDKTG